MSASLLNRIISTFGGIPNLIQESISDFKVEGGEYRCDLCETAVCRVSDNRSLTDTSFTEHLSGSSHQDKSNEKKRFITNFETKVEDLFYSTYPRRDIPPIIFVNLSFFSCEKEHKPTIYPECSLCKESFYFSGYDLVNTEEKIVHHLLSKEHEDKIKQFYDKCNKVRVELEKVYGVTPPPVVDNVEHIKATSGNCNYQCKLCSKTVHVQDSTSVEEFLSHLRSADHKKKADQHRVVVKAPELAQLYQTEQIPYYIINNIEYIIYKDFPKPNVYCSLCNKSFSWEFDKYNKSMRYKTRQDLKHHFLSHDHEEQLFCNLDPSNACYKRLHLLFDTFPIPVQKDFKYLGIKGNNFFCLSCETEIIIENDDNDTQKNILAHFLIGPKSIDCSIHSENEIYKKLNYDKVEADVRKMFDSIPDEILKNIEYLSAPSSEETYLYCDICEGNKKLQLNEREILKHLLSTQHVSLLESFESMDKETEAELCAHFKSDRFITNPPKLEVDPIPKSIRKKLSYVSYEDTSNIFEYGYSRCFPVNYSSSDDEDYKQTKSKDLETQRVKGNNLLCNICYYYESNPSIILIGRYRSYYKYELDEDDKNLNRRETEYNFRTHFLSQEHKFNLQRKKLERLQTITTLKQLYAEIPSYAENNIHQIISGRNIYEKMDSSLLSSFSGYCNLCEKITYIGFSDKSQFESHFIGMDKWSTETEHQIKETEADLSNTIAMAELEVRFRQVPRVVLRDIEFLSECEANLFCILCQETIFIEGDDLEKIQSDLCLHMRSKKHMVVLNGVRRY